MERKHIIVDPTTHKHWKTYCSSKGKSIGKSTANLINNFLSNNESQKENNKEKENG